MIKQQKYGIYQVNYDITFIIIDTYKDEEIISSECVGWYHGEPSEEDNEFFTGKLKATYGWEDKKMKERILNTLEAYLITNRDVMEEDHIKDVEEQIETIKNMDKILFEFNKGGK
jgi:hypothetical protein